MKKEIVIKGAKTHNLKNINLNIPKNSFCVITGLSGGNVKLNIYQNVRGVKKFDTCYITVTTPVSDMYIETNKIYNVN